MQANLLVPLHYGAELWGLLCIHQCAAPRHWQSFEIDFVTQIASHLSIAIQQSQLLTQTRQQAQQLEDTVRDLQQVQMQLLQAEKMSTLGQVAAGISHEINNPVNFISGNLRHIQSHVQPLMQMLQVYEKHCPTGIPEVEEAIAHLDIHFLVEIYRRWWTRWAMGRNGFGRWSKRCKILPVWMRWNYRFPSGDVAISTQRRTGNHLPD